MKNIKFSKLEGSRTLKISEHIMKVKIPTIEDSISSPILIPK